MEPLDGDALRDLEQILEGADWALLIDYPKLPADWRSRLPMPEAYYRARVPELSAVNRRGWARGKCPFHKEHEWFGIHEELSRLRRACGRAVAVTAQTGAALATLWTSTSV